jgi:zinc transport system ATP-binding protein
MITVNNLSVKYDSGYAIKDVSFSIESGDYLCIVGENGSGKTTLMKSMLKLIKPSGGSVDMSGIKQNEIGFIPQQTIVQKDFPSSVYEVVLSGFQSKTDLLPFYSRKQKKLAIENIARMGAEAFIRKSYRDLSGGQQQRVLLARALCATDKIMFLDEPAAGLDPLMSADLYSILLALNKQGITIVMISHDITSAVKYGNKILHMYVSPLFFGATADYVRSDIGRRMIGGGIDV